MPTYTDVELSVHAGAPVECYRFVGTLANYLLTSADADVTLNGELYKAVPITRKALKIGTQEDNQLVLDVSMPYDQQIIKDYAYIGSPPALSLDLRRSHIGLDFATQWVSIWKGKIVSFVVDGRTATIRSATIFSGQFSQPIPSRLYQSPCNHVLYDPRCTINPASWTFSKTIAGFGSPTDVKLTSASGITDGILVAGEMINQRTSERRCIKSNVSIDIGVTFPFFDARIGDTVTLRAGCDHSFAACRDKFSNSINFGGCPYIPAENPFQGSL
jgi:uncharacterized phage protein (TIGR02218 family)